MSPNNRAKSSNGEIKWQGGKLYISESLVGEVLGLRQTHWGDWLVFFSYLPLALIDYRALKLKPFPATQYAQALATAPSESAQLRS